MTLQVQFLTMIYMVFGGIYLGIALETFRRFSPIWRNNKFLVYCLEVCFWLIQTIVLFYILYRVNNGELRVYVFIACFLGFSIYQVLFVTLYKQLLEHMISLFLALYRFCKKVIQALLISPIIWVISAMIMIIKSVLLLFLKIVKIVCYPILWLSKLIFFLLPKRFRNILYKTPRMYSIIKNTFTKWSKYFKRR